MRDPLGVSGAFRGAPHFGDVQFVGLAGQAVPNGVVSNPGHSLGQYAQFGGYGSPEADPRRRYADSRMQREDPRDRALLEVQLAAQQMAAGGTPTSATQRSISQLGAIGQQGYQSGGRGMPTAARGGSFAGPVRVHAGEVVQPDGMGGVQVLDPFQAQEIDRQVAASDARVQARVDAAMRPRREDARMAAQYRDVTGADPLAAPMGQTAEMDRIMAGGMNPHDASPEVRAGFMERWAGDPRWAASVRDNWNAASAPARTPIEEQRRAGAEFAAQQAARPQAEKDDILARAAAREDRLRAQSALVDARRKSDMNIRREALVRDVPLGEIKGPDAQYGIDDVLFERTRNRRSGVQMGLEPVQAGIERQARFDAEEGATFDRETRRIAALMDGRTNRNDAAVTAAEIRTAGDILSNPDSPPEAVQAAMQILGQRGGVGGLSSGQDSVPPPIGGAWGTASPAAKEAAQSVLGLRDSPESESGWVTEIDTDLRDLSDIRANNWMSDDPNQLAGYRQSLDRYLDAVSRAAQIPDDEGRRIALDVLNRKAQEYGLGGSDVIAFGAGPVSGSYGRVVKGKQEITGLIARLLDGGRLTPAEIGRIRSIYGSKQRQQSAPSIPVGGGMNAEM